MMNHELRTPMNGVMGLLALARQTDLTPAQDRLLSQAETSGRQMSTLLSDILDYSELDGPKMRLVRSPTSLNTLAHTARELMINQHSDRIKVLKVPTPAAGWDTMLIDADRVHQILTHVARYLVDVVEVSALELSFAHDQGALDITIDVETPPMDGPGWQPESVFLREPEPGDRFATDAIGPAIVRGLIDRMSGQMTLQRPSGTRAVLQIKLAAQRIEAPRPIAWIETCSEASRALMERMLEQNGWETQSEGRPTAPIGVALIELSGRDDTRTAARIRAQYPGAVLLAVGHSRQPELYDAICPSIAQSSQLCAAIPKTPAPKTPAPKTPALSRMAS